MAIPLFFDLTAKAVSQFSDTKYPAVLANAGANNNDVLQITKSPSGSQSGKGLLVTMGANSTDNGISVSSSGSAIALVVTGKLPASFTQSASSSGTPNLLVLTGAANTGMATTVEAVDYDFNSAQTKTWVAGNITTQRTAVFRAPTIAFASGSNTVTSAATLAVTDAPTQGANATLTNAYSIWAQAGRTQLDGGLNVTGAAGLLSFTQSAASSGTPSPALTFAFGAHTGLTNAEAIDVTLNLNRTVTFTGGGGTQASQRAIRIRNPTYAAAAAHTITTAETVRIEGAPVAGTNVTLTNAYALRVLAGKSYFADNVGINVIASAVQSALHVVEVAGGLSGATPAAGTVLTVERGADTSVSILSPAANGGNIFFGSPTSNVRGVVGYNHSTDTMHFSAGATTFLTAQGASPRKVSIGNGDFTATGQLHVFGSATDLIVDNQSSTTSVARILSNTDGIVYVQAGSSTSASQCDIKITNMTATKTWMTIKGSTAGDVAITANAVTTGTPQAFSITGAAHTGMTASTEVVQALHDFGQTYTWLTGALTTQRFNYFKKPTIAFNTGSNTVTNTATLAIEDAPAQGANATLTNSFALWVLAGMTQLDGRATITGTTTTTTGILSVTQNAASSGSPKIVTFTGAANTGMTNAEAIDVAFALGQTKTFTGGGGAIATQRAVRIVNPTYAASAAQTITAAATLAIVDAPTQGTNVTLTNTYALWVQAGKSQFDGIVKITNSSGNSLSFTNTGAAATIQISASNGISITQTAASGGSPHLFGGTAGAHTNMTTELTDWLFDNARIVTYAGTSSLTNQRTFYINQGPNIASNVNMTITNAAVMAIGPGTGTSGAGGGTVTITNNYSIWAETKCRMDAAVALGGGASATLGTIGGSGPTTAAQNEWLELHTQNGKRFVPCWA